MLLYVRVKYILKFFVIKNKIRRLVFFDEFIGKNVNLNLNKLRREKLKLVLRFLFLLLLDCYKKNFYNVKISFVSVFDLYDIVDFSIWNKGNKEEILRYLGMESFNSKFLLLFIDCFVVGGGNWKMLRNGSKFVSLFLIF